MEDTNTRLTNSVLNGLRDNILNEQPSTSQLYKSDSEDEKNQEELRKFIGNVIITNPSVDMANLPPDFQHKTSLDALTEEGGSSLDTLDCIESHGLVSPARSACVSPASSNGGVYSVK